MTAPATLFMSRWIAFVMLFGTATPLIAQRPRATQSASGSIEGDWFLVMGSGDTKPIAGQPVALVRIEEEKISPMRERCGEAGISAPAVRDPIWLRLARDMTDLTIATAGSGIRAHFRFADVPPGVYLLYAITSLYDRGYMWIVPVTVRAGGATSQDLDNAYVHTLSESELAVWTAMSSPNRPTPPVKAGEVLCKVLG